MRPSLLYRLCPANLQLHRILRRFSGGQSSKLFDVRAAPGLRVFPYGLSAFVPLCETILISDLTLIARISGTLIPLPEP